MDKRQADLVRESYHDILLIHSEMFSKIFYDNFFRLYPAAHQIFRETDMKTQCAMLLAAITMVIDSLEDSMFESTLRSMGERHNGYGVSPEGYAAFGEALIMTVAGFSRLKWTDELHEGWKAFYSEMVSVMTSEDASVTTSS